MGTTFICPYCGHEHKVSDYMKIGLREKLFKMDCEKCEKEFSVETSIHVEFKAMK